VNETPVVLRVTSVSPAVDPGARTGVVEALYPNPDERFRPGQFVTMEITVGTERDAVVVPTAAVQRESETTRGVLATGERAYVWVAEPGMNGEYDVRRQPVTLGERAGAMVAIREGVQAGQSVVVSPPQGLREGVRVTTDAAPVASAELKVTVTERGFEPATLTIPPNRPTKITFLRKVDPSCGDTILFPDLGIKKELPLNKPVVVELPARPGGELRFTCDMDMYRGKVIVQ
jgi:hypothetical protein